MWHQWVVADLNPHQGTCLGQGFSPRTGLVGEAADQCFSLTWMFLSPSFSVPSPLAKNTYIHVYVRTYLEFIFSCFPGFCGEQGEAVLITAYVCVRFKDGSPLSCRGLHFTHCSFLSVFITRHGLGTIGEDRRGLVSRISGLVWDRKVSDPYVHA